VGKLEVQRKGEGLDVARVGKLEKGIRTLAQDRG